MTASEADEKVATKIKEEERERRATREKSFDVSPSSPPPPLPIPPGPTLPPSFAVSIRLWLHPPSRAKRTNERCLLSPQPLHKSQEREGTQSSLTLSLSLSSSPPSTPLVKIFFFLQAKAGEDDDQL